MNKPLLIALLILLSSGLSKTSGQNLIITGVMDGDLDGGLPKAIEICVLNDITDLSEYSIAMVYNANASPATQFTFPAVAASAGQNCITCCKWRSINNYMGYEADYIQIILAETETTGRGGGEWLRYRYRLGVYRWLRTLQEIWTKLENIDNWDIYKKASIVHNENLLFLSHLNHLSQQGHNHRDKWIQQLQ